MRTPLFALLAVVSLAAFAWASSESDPVPLSPVGARKSAPAPAGAAVPTPVEGDFPDLTSGRYEIKLSGVLCSVCTRAIAEELAKLKEVENIKTDLDRDSVTLTVKLKKVLKIGKLKHSLRRASKRAHLGTEYGIAAVRYIP